MFAVLLFQALFSMAVSTPIEDTTVIGQVNGFPIVRQELDFILTPFRSSIASLKGDSGRIPKDSIASLFQEAVRYTVEYKLQNILAVEAGILQDPSYRGFHQTWLEENRSRKKAREQNRIVYGPIEFSEYAYFEYRGSLLKMRLKERMLGGSNRIPETEIIAYYDTVKEKLFKQPDSLFLIIVQLPSVTDTVREVVKTVLSTTTDTSKLIRFGCSIQYRTIDGSEGEELMEEESKVHPYAVALQPGEVSDWFTLGNSEAILKCIDRKSRGYSSYTVVRDLVRSRVIDERYAKVVSQKYQNAVVEMDNHLLNTMLDSLLEENGPAR